MANECMHTFIAFIMNGGDQNKERSTTTRTMEQLFSTGMFY